MKQLTEQKFEQIIFENQLLILKICNIYCNAQADKDDLFQEIMINLWKGIKSYRGDSKLSTWIYRVGLNTAITLYRKSKRTIKTQQFESVSFRIKSLEYDDTEEQQLKLLYKAVHQLNDIEKALVLLYLEDKKYDEISETLGISEVNARVKMNRVKKKLRTILNP